MFPLLLAWNMTFWANAKGGLLYLEGCLKVTHKKPCSGNFGRHWDCSGLPWRTMKPCARMKLELRPSTRQWREIGAFGTGQVGVKNMASSFVGPGATCGLLEGPWVPSFDKPDVSRISPWHPCHIAIHSFDVPGSGRRKLVCEPGQVASPRVKQTG